MAGVGQDNLGYAVVEKLLQAGYGVIMLARTEQTLKTHYTNYQQKLTHPGQLQFYCVDLTQQKAVSQLVRTIQHSGTQIDAIINTTGKWMGNQPILTLCADTTLTSITQNALPLLNLISTLFSGGKVHPVSIIDLAGATSSLRNLANAVPNYYAFWAGKRLLYGYLQSLVTDIKQANLSVYQYIIDGLLDNARTRKLSPDIEATQFISQRRTATHVVDLLKKAQCGQHHEYHVTLKGIQRT